MAFIETPMPSVALMSGKAQQFLRQYGSVPQPLAADNIPGAGAATGLGTGGAIGMGAMPSNGATGAILVRLGPGFAQDLTIDVVFPSTPPPLFWSCNFGTFEVSTEDDKTYTLTFSEVIGIARSEPWLASFQPVTAR